MSVSGKFELNITTSTQEEMDRVAEAIYSGFAENIIKQHVLWSQFMPPATGPVQSAPVPELKKVTTKAKESSTTTPPTPTKRSAQPASSVVAG